MPETNISSADYSDLKNVVSSYSVAPQQTDGVQDQDETEYQNSKWSQQLGYYKSIPELHASVNSIAAWTIGKGYTANEITELVLMQIKGFGVDTFNTILENDIIVYNISGDSFNEIIRDDEGNLINLKPLDPSTIKIIADKKGIIKRYEQTSKTNLKQARKFKPEEIFHLSRNRVADEIHGVSMIDAIENIILARNEAIADYRQLLHRNVKPRFIHHLDTDDTTKIAEYKAKADKAVDQGENLYIPKGAVEIELSSVPSNATLNPLPWIESLNQYFFQATGVPDIILGSSKNLTEASSKIAYLAFQQRIEEEQLYIEQQVLAQLNLEIELTFPASLQNELLSDQNKAESIQAATPEDTSMTKMQPQEVKA